MLFHDAETLLLAYADLVKELTPHLKRWEAILKASGSMIVNHHEAWTEYTIPGFGKTVPLEISGC